MTVKQIIRMASKLLQKNAIVEYIDGGEASIDVQKDIDQMLDCYNSVICELSEEYLPLKAVETIKCKNGQIAFSTFSKTPLEIIACYVDSQEIAFKQSLVNLIVPVGNVTVVYEYQPKAFTIDDENAYNDTIVSSRIIALAVARDYLLNTGLYSEASIFDNRFRQAITSVMLSKKTNKLRARGWY